MTSHLFESLDYLYVPAPDFEAAVRFYIVTIGGEVRRRLADEGWSDVDPPFEIPQGPCLVFRDPGGQRLAIYERVRPGIDEKFEGRFDA